MNRIAQVTYWLRKLAHTGGLVLTCGVIALAAAAQTSLVTPKLVVNTPPYLLPGATLTIANVRGVATDPTTGAAIAGTIAYTPALGTGTVLAAGPHAVSAVFTPADPTYYTTASATKTITVLSPEPTATTVTATPNPVLPGQSFVLSASVAPFLSGVAGAVPGSVAFSTGSGPTSSPIGSATTLSLDPGHAAFAAGTVQTFGTGSYFDYNTYTADFNADGAADLLIVPDYGSPGLMLSQLSPSLTFAAPVTLNLGSSCSSIFGLAVGDMNGDGLPDIAAACYYYDPTTGPSYNLFVLLNQGGGNFAAANKITAFGAGISTVQMVLDDFNGDGHPDLVVLTACQYGSACVPTLNFLQGDGTGNFTVANTEFVNNASSADAFQNLLAANFSGHSRPDLAFLHFSGTAPSEGVIEIWNNSGGSVPSFGANVANPACLNPGSCYAANATVNAGDGSSTLSSLVTADFNQDGRPDLALVTIANGTGSVSSYSVALNSSTGFLSTANVATPGAQAVVTADFDKDGLTDLALYVSDTSTNTVSVLHGNGDGTFSAKELGLTFPLSAPVPIDTIGIAAPGPSSARPRSARSAGVRPADSYSGGYVYPLLTVGDVNGDGYPDILAGQLVVNATTGLYSVSGEQFAVSGPAIGSLTSPLTAPSITTLYQATTTPATGDTYWAPSTGSTTLTVTPLATTTSLNVMPVVGAPSSPTFGYGLQLGATVLNPSPYPPPSTGTVSFYEDGTALAGPSKVNAAGSATLTIGSPTAGTHHFYASYNPAPGEATSTSPTDTVDIAKFPTTISWPTPASILTTTPLGLTQLDAAAQGPPGFTPLGAYLYTPAAGTLLSAGTHTLGVSFTPTDTNDYTSATGSTSIHVTEATTSTTFVVSSSAPVYGQPLTLTATVLSTSGSPVVNGGTVVFTSGTSTLGSGGVTVVNGAASLTGVLLPAGTHVLDATYSGDSTEAGSAATAQTITVAKATPYLTWPTPARITTTTALSAAQLDAVATSSLSSTLALPGAYTYTPAAGTLLTAGTHTLSVLFTPTDTVDYSTATATVSITVVEATTSTSFVASSASPVYGQPITLTATVVSTSGSPVVNGGTVVFTAGSTTLGSAAVVGGSASVSGILLPGGPNVLEATYSGNSTEGGSAAPTQTVTVSKATPTLTWATPATITPATPLSSTQLDAAATGTTGATLPGTFVYTPAAGTTLSAGAHTLSAVFTPTDTTDYATATTTVSISVATLTTSTTLVVSAASPVYGQPLTLSATVVNTGSSPLGTGGTVAFTSGASTLGTATVVSGAASLSGVLLPAGAHAIVASYSGTTSEAGSSSAVYAVSVTQATPTLTWPTPASITATTPLSGAQLNATAVGTTGAVLPGSFSYTPAAGTLLLVGSHTLNVTFTPADSTDYTTATTHVIISVVAETITLSSISPSTTLLGKTPLPVVLTGAGFPSTSIVRLNRTALPTTVISATQLGATVPAASLGTAGTLSFTIYDPASFALSNAISLPVTAPTPTVTVSAPATATSGTQPTVGLTLATAYPVDITGTLTLTFDPAGENADDDPAIQFSTGGRTYDFTIPAGTVTGPTVALQTGTVEGKIAVTPLLTAGGVDVTPADIAAPTVITITPSAPIITGVTFTDANGLLTVVVTGFSNTREMTQAEFLFTGPDEVDLASPAVTIPATSLFGAWYTSADSATFGSTFTYTQSFQLSDANTKITGVAVTLSNTVGTSASVNSK
jgi:hypothetical protein